MTETYWDRTYRGQHKTYTSNGTGRLALDVYPNIRADTFRYDASGNEEFKRSHGLGNGEYAVDRTSFYDGSGRLGKAAAWFARETGVIPNVERSSDS